jgi:hypothetical protein
MQPSHPRLVRAVAAMLSVATCLACGGGDDGAGDADAADDAMDRAETDVADRDDADDAVDQAETDGTPPRDPTLFYVDPDYAGDDADGSAQHPWSAFGDGPWAAIDEALAANDVVVYFSAREAAEDTDEVFQGTVGIYRTSGSTYRVTLDGMSRYNTDDAAPSWSDYAGTSRLRVMADYAINSADETTPRDYVTIRGFKAVAGVGGAGGQIVYLGAGSHVVIERNELWHDPAVAHGAAFQIGYAHHASGGGNGGCTDIVIRNNVIHDTAGECLYIGGSEDTGLPAHSNVVIEGNTIYNCGVYGGEGNCIDVKDGLTDVVVRGNICFDGAPGDNVTGITSHSAMIAEANIVHDMPNHGLATGTFWGRGFSGTRIINNLIYNNGADGIQVATDTADRPIDDVRILHNTIFGNVRDGILLGSGADGIGTVVIVNNLIIDNAVGIGGWGTTSHTISHNDVFGNGTNFEGAYAAASGTAGNIAADPGFAGSASGDFHLAAGSSAIDSGEAVEVDRDLEGTARPQGAGWDMGAYERAP